MPIGTVLHVDDSRDMRELTKRAFKRAGLDIEYIGTDSGHEALRWIVGPEAPANLLVILDLHMPEMSGLEILGELGKRGVVGRRPVVMLSSSDDPQERADCMVRGATRYCPKPKDLTALVDLTKQLGDLLVDGPAGTAPSR